MYSKAINMTVCMCDVKEKESFRKHAKENETKVKCMHFHSTNTAKAPTWPYAKIVPVANADEKVNDSTNQTTHNTMHAF
jgi:hypothetical protein